MLVGKKQQQKKQSLFFAELQVQPVQPATPPKNAVTLKEEMRCFVWLGFQCDSIDTKGSMSDLRRRSF